MGIKRAKTKPYRCCVAGHSRAWSFTTGIRRSEGILTAKYGEQLRQLQAYMDQLETMASLKGSDIKGFEKFSDLVRVPVVELQVEGRESELGAGTFHNLLVNKLTDKQVQSYRWWLADQKIERSVLNLNDWPKKKVQIRVEAARWYLGWSKEMR